MMEFVIHKSPLNTLFQVRMLDFLNSITIIFLPGYCKVEANILLIITLSFFLIIEGPPVNN